MSLKCHKVVWGMACSHVIMCFTENEWFVTKTYQRYLYIHLVTETHHILELKESAVSSPGRMYANTYLKIQCSYMYSTTQYK